MVKSIVVPWHTYIPNIFFKVWTAEDTNVDLWHILTHTCIHTYTHINFTYTKYLSSQYLFSF